MDRRPRRDLPVSGLRSYGDQGPREGPAELRVKLGDTTGAFLPGVGFALDVPSDGIGPTVATRARTLRPSHLRVDVDLSSDSRSTVLYEAHDASAEIGAPLELALSGVDAVSRSVLFDWISQAPSGVDVVRIIIIGDDVWLPTTGSQEQLRDLVRERWPDASVLAGARTNFDIANRDWASTGSVDGVAFGMQPQWHTDDDLSLIESLDGQADAARSARSRMGDRMVAISPLTLGPDYEGRLADPRQRSLFGAVWTVGSIDSLSAGGVDSATYYRLLGPAGLMGSGTAASEASPDQGGPVYPCFHVFADLADGGGAPVRESTPEGDYPATALAIDGRGGQRILVGSFAPVPVELSVTGLQDGPWRLRILDHTSAEFALYEPGRFRAEWTEAPAQGGIVRTKLGPFGVVALVRDQEADPGGLR